MELGTDPVPLVRVGRSDGRLRLGVLAVALLVALAVAKPWAPPEQSGPVATTPTPAAIAAPVPSAGPLASAARREGTTGAAAALLAADPSSTCFGTLDWELVTDGSFLGRPSRTWRPVTVAAAHTPLDPAIPLITVTSAGVIAMGFCAPARAAQPVDDSWRATLWRLDPGGSGAPPTYRVVAHLSATAAARGAVASPPATVRRASPEWTPGVYVLQVLSDPVSGAGGAWFGVQVRAPAS